MDAEGVDVELIHMLDHRIGFGMVKDTTEIGDDVDDWPAIHARIMAADILVIGTPIWLGVKSSVATLAIERLYAYSSDTNDCGPVPVLRQGGWVCRHRQRGRREGLRDGDAVRARRTSATRSRRRRTVAGSARSARAELRRSGRGLRHPDGLRQRVHEQERHDHELEPDARRQDAEGPGRFPGRWQRCRVMASTSPTPPIRTPTATSDPTDL